MIKDSIAGHLEVVEEKRKIGTTQFRVRKVT